eukprot:66130_1
MMSLSMFIHFVLQFTFVDAYIYVNSDLTWQQADTYCMDHHYRHLATIYDDESAQELRDLVNAKDNNAWMGLNDIDVEGTWVYADGTPCPDCGSPNDINSGYYWSPHALPDSYDCVWIARSSWKVEDMLFSGDCTFARPFICNEIIEIPYIFVNSDLNWQEADTYCMDHYNSHLATIHDDDSSQILQYLLGERTAWIGLNDINSEGTWVYADGTLCHTEDGNCDSDYAYWYTGYPITGINYDCGLMDNIYMLLSGPCSITRPFICNPPYSSLFTIGSYVKLKARGCDTCLNNNPDSAKANLVDCNTATDRIQWQLTNTVDDIAMRFRFINKHSGKNLVLDKDKEYTIVNKDKEWKKVIITVAFLKVKPDPEDFFDISYEKDDGTYYIKMKHEDTNKCPKWDSCSDTELTFTGCSLLYEPFNFQVIFVDAADAKPIPDSLIFDEYHMVIVLVVMAFIATALVALIYALVKQHEHKFKILNQDDSEESDYCQEEEEENAFIHKS